MACALFVEGQLILYIPHTLSDSLSVGTVMTHLEKPSEVPLLKTILHLGLLSEALTRCGHFLDEGYAHLEYLPHRHDFT